MNELRKLAKQLGPLIEQLVGEDEQDEAVDNGTLDNGTLEVIAERDALRRQLANIRAAHEGLHRALYPGQYG